MSLVSSTDYWEERRLGPLGSAATTVLRRRVADMELNTRRRIIEGQRTPPVPSAPTPKRGIWKREAEAPPDNIDFRPDRQPRFELSITHSARDEIIGNLVAAAPYDVETGGHFFSHERPRLNWVEVAKATGPAPHSKHSRAWVQLGEAADVEAEFGEFTRRADLKAVGCWHSHPWGDGQPSRQDLRVWAHRLKETGWFRYVGLIAMRDPGPLGWGAPILRPWLVSENAGGRYTCEPIRIREGA